jgi:hypothetical protein
MRSGVGSIQAEATRLRRQADCVCWRMVRLSSSGRPLWANAAIYTSPGGVAATGWAFRYLL